MNQVNKFYQVVKIKSNLVLVGDLIQAEGEWWKCISNAYKFNGEWCIDIMLSKHLAVVHPMSIRPSFITVKRPI